VAFAVLGHHALVHDDVGKPVRLTNFGGGVGCPLGEVLQQLSEAPEGSLRMSQLANYVSLTGSGLTRVVERLSRRGLVERVRPESDGRGQCAVLTPAGVERLKEAWPTHVASVRRHVLDHLAGLDLDAFADAVGKIAEADVGPPIHRSQRAVIPQPGQ
jgi:DNA-binding MarR family transcriptional regulator